MTEKFVFKKPNFGPPPKGYVAGIGRGAVGFITRGDLGPAAIAQNKRISEGQNQDQGTGEPQAKYDSWAGEKGALFSKNIVDEEDRLAEQAYDYCERKMDERRSKQREQKLKEQMEKSKKDPNLTTNVPINEKFKDLKRELAKISVEQWQAIPQSNDSSIKKKTREKYTPVPDSVMVSYLSNNNSNSVVEDESNKDYRDAKETLFRSKLDNIEQKQSSMAVDRVGYLTQLNSSKMDLEMLGDLTRARLLLKSAATSNPKNADIWMSAARVEELDGKLNEAREILRKGVANCPMNEDIWIEYSRIQRHGKAKDVIVQGLRHLPKSEKLWIYASKLQRDDKEMKSKILRKGLENNPDSVRLWKELIEIEDVQEAKQLLYKAVEFIPKQVDLWIALSKIENYDNAKKVLNMARKANPLSEGIWIHAAKLEETKFVSEQGRGALKNTKNRSKIETILVKARDVLRKNGKNFTRDEWLDQAYYCEKSQSYLTCEAIVKISVSYGLNEEQTLNSLLKDAKIFEEQRESVQTVRFLYRHGLSVVKDLQLFQKYIDFQERVDWRAKQQMVHEQEVKEGQLSSEGSKGPQKQSIAGSEVIDALNLGTSLFPTECKFWLLTIEKYIKLENYQMAEKVISMGERNIDSQYCEEIKLQRVNLLKKQGLLTEARCELEILCNHYPRGRSKVELIKLEYEAGNYEQAWALCENFYRDMHIKDLWVLAFKILLKLHKQAQAKNLIEKAVDIFSTSNELWKLWIDLELNNKNIGRARSILDKALLKNPKDEELYLLSFELEYKHGTLKDSMFLLSKAVKACPKSPELWSKVLQIEPVATRKKKASVAVENCGPASAVLNCTIAKIFWKENKIEKAKKWISSSLELERENGDIWCLYLLLLQQSFPLEFKILSEEFNKEDIKAGRKWLEETQKAHKGESKQTIKSRVTHRIEEEMLRIQ